MNPPDLWIHGTAVDVGDKISDDEQQSTVRSSSLAARSGRIGSSKLTCVTLHCVALLRQMPIYVCGDFFVRMFLLKQSWLNKAQQCSIQIHTVITCDVTKAA